jgi:hypothetical protein
MEDLKRQKYLCLVFFFLSLICSYQNKNIKNHTNITIRNIKIYSFDCFFLKKKTFQNKVTSREAKKMLHRFLFEFGLLKIIIYIR